MHASTGAWDFELELVLDEVPLTVKFILNADEGEQNWFNATNLQSQQPVTRAVG